MMKKISDLNDNIHFSLDDLKKKLNNEISLNQSKLLNLAKNHCSKLGRMEPEELIHETLKRFLEGTRRWKKDKPFLQTFNLAMRSIANEKYENEKRNNFVSEIGLSENNDNSIYEMIPSQIPDPERQIISKEKSKSIQVLFDNDKVTQAVLDMKLNGYTRKDIMEKLSLSSKEYNKAFKKISRRIKSDILL